MLCLSLYLPDYIFYSICMKRASERVSPTRKGDVYRKKSPSAIFKSEITAFKPKSYLQYPTSILSLHLAQEATDALLELVHTAIDKIEENKFYTSLFANANFLSLTLESAYSPKLEAGHTGNTPEEEPETSYPDHFCGCDRVAEKKREKKVESVPIPCTPLKEIESRNKNALSSKDLLHVISKKGSKGGLVPLKNVESEKDLRISQIHTFYRDKFAREQLSNTEESIPQLMQAAGRLKKLNAKEHEQFTFDYNCEKIPISNLTSLKKTNLNVLKTIYKIHKDRTEIKNNKKSQQTISYTRLPGATLSSKSIQQSFDISQLKHGIEKNVNWQGKLSSIKMISEANEKN